MKRASFTLALICGAQFVLQLDFSIVNVALPAIERELRFAAAELQWVVTGYALTFGSLLLVAGVAQTCSGAARCSSSVLCCSRSRRSPAVWRSRR